MRIVFRRLHRMANVVSGEAYYTKTNPYPNDSAHFTNKLKKQTLWQRFCNLFRAKLNPKSFSDGSHTPKGPYVASRQSVELSNKYLERDYISENHTILDGFRDGGHSCQFSHFGDVLYSNREVVTIDRKLDTYLSNAIKYVKEETAGMNEQDKVKTIYKVIHQISGDFYKSEKRANILAKERQGKEILLGKVFEKECATCRHKALMFKLLADECGLQARMIRGAAFDLSGFGGHAWNEIKLSNGKKLLIDVQNSRIIDLSTKKALKKAEVASYCDSNLKPYYKE